MICRDAYRVIIEKEYKKRPEYRALFTYEGGDSELLQLSIFTIIGKCVESVFNK